MNNNFKSNLNQAIKIIFNVETIAPFLVGSLCLGIFSSAIYDLIKKAIGESIPKFLLIAAIAMAIAIFAIYILSKKLEYESRPKINPQTQYKRSPQPHRGLILLVSRQQPCQVAIDFHLGKLEQCWLLCSAQSLADAQELQSMYSDRVFIHDPIVINDVYDPIQYIEELVKIYSKLPPGWKETDVIADFVGMTANGSVGMALFCCEKNLHLQYTPAVIDKETNRIIGSAQPIEIKLG